MEDYEPTHEKNIIALLSDWYWYVTHPKAELEAIWHIDEQGREFAERVMAFALEELKRYDE